ncbi:MAG: tyrosine-type recombinase/integrase, partial [Deltaproteobacteria bacterium]|nr:tyrosine-type recombinase/integrase [Deltaproteobacteria bacterium]
CDLVDGWYEHQLKIKVYTGLRSKINHDDYLGSLKKWFGDYLRKPAAQLNSYVLAEIFEKMKAQGLSLGHRKKLKQVVKSVFDFGIGSGLLTNVLRSPTMDIALQRGEEKKPEILTLQELQTLIQKAFDDDHPWKMIWATALLTGMRSGELYALEWKDVDWENKILSITKSYNCRMRETKSTKAGTWRQVPMSQKLMEIMRSYTARLLCDPDATARGRGGQGDEDMRMERAQDYAALRETRRHRGQWRNRGSGDFRSLKRDRWRRTSSASPFLPREIEPAPRSLDVTERRHIPGTRFCNHSSLRRNQRAAPNPPFL